METRADGCGCTVLKESDTTGKRQPSEYQIRIDEAKLDAALLRSLRPAESADTSEVDRFNIEGILIARGDTSGRVQVVMDPWGTPGFANVMPVFDSLNAQIEHVGESAPFIICWVRPIDLRQLITIGSVKRVAIPIRGETDFK